MGVRPSVVEDRGLAWAARVPMLGSRFFWGDMLRWALLTGVACSIILAVVFQVVPDAGPLIPVLGYIWIVVAGLFVATLLIALVMFRNAYVAAYRLDAHGIGYELVSASSKLGRAVTAGTLALGLLTGSAQGAGAGLLAAAGRSVDVTWAEVKRIIRYPHDRVISIRNAWRTLFRLHCADDETYERVAAFVDERLARDGR